MTKQTGTLALLIAIVALTGGCVASPGGLQPSAGSPNEVPSATVPRGPGETQSALAALSPEDFWTALVPGDPAAVSYSSMEAILADADAVVLASLGNLTRGPAYADKYGNVSYWGVLTLEVDRVLHGSLDTKTPGTVALLVFLGVGGATDTYDDRLAQLMAAKPAERGIFFLSNMAEWVRRSGGATDLPEADPHLCEVLGGQGFLRDVGGLVEPPHLSPDQLATMAGRWQEALRGRPFAEVVSAIAAVP
ncbi:MAG: hypothetical protein M0T75_05665 [Chloroflexi bacterium]|nr:hypothetical protein [Chloroflexota bacterium]